MSRFAAYTIPYFYRGLRNEGLGPVTAYLVAILWRLGSVVIEDADDDDESAHPPSRHCLCKDCRAYFKDTQ